MADWEGINEFIAVAETGSFTRAAERLGSSVAHVSRRIKAREQRMGTSLLQRTTRKVSLTEEGRIYYQHCRQILDALTAADSELANLQHTPTGHLRVTAPVSFGEKYVAPLVSAFAQAHPGLTIDLNLSNQRLDLIDESIDLAIRLGPLKNEQLIAKKLAERQPIVCASPEYLAQHGQPHTPAELSTHNCLLGTLDVWRFSEAGRAFTVPVKGNLRCNNGPALRDAARNGLGVVQLPDYYLQQALATGQLIELLHRYAPAREGIWALYPPNRRLSPKVQRLISYLELNLKKL
ncbi:LysR substrate-binding domain-containing protein [Gilvimarinus polysaccharolyticus]|uniref:LysR substrate-binding domain-containing protein n=1 Tax=Gilvimarinus polysaccharolyticus TaxID=863921 RepID=UPI0006737D8A|nr:LysR substrate-binding domain-containing protein [Gilvimarinus polysaccharolyticus]